MSRMKLPEIMTVSRSGAERPETSNFILHVPSGYQYARMFVLYKCFEAPEEKKEKGLAVILPWLTMSGNVFATLSLCPLL